jgi:hypothetical protein
MLLAANIAPAIIKAAPRTLLIESPPAIAPTGSGQVLPVKSTAGANKKQARFDPGLPDSKLMLRLYRRRLTNDGDASRDDGASHDANRRDDDGHASGPRSGRYRFWQQLPLHQRSGATLHSPATTGQ